ncbi:radical SAM protein, partial [Bacteriovorax sp. DB6_IX]|uniref:radical SAM protein n=1 Tax=Bacteriovorax sp. DB6_IX TaxID=1353530 RepID=UPI00038A45C5
MSKEFFDSLDPTEHQSIETKLRINALKNCIPLNVTIELSQQCNFRCSHCYNFDRTQSNSIPSENKLSPKLSQEEVLRIISEIKQQGALSVCFTGGEVLLERNLEIYIQKAKEIGLNVRLKS